MGKIRYINRPEYQTRFEKILQAGRASIVVMYGRRRVGKTTLVEHFFGERDLLKFEGVEGQNSAYQKRAFLQRLFELTKNPAATLVSSSNPSWIDNLTLLAKHTADGPWTIFLEELQWLAAYDDELVAALKYCWDNYFSKNNQLVLVLCGSSPSFMVNEVLHSKALYNRAVHEMHIGQFSLHQIGEFIGKNRPTREIFDAALTVGGIPEYLHYVCASSSIYTSLLQSAFLRGGFFVDEYNRIFVSSLDRKPEYRKTVEFLNLKAYAERPEISKHLGMTGGGLSELLQDLELCELVDSYRPATATTRGRLLRYTAADRYCQFFTRFIQPILPRIKSGEFERAPERALSLSQYQQWLGTGFERYLRKRAHLVAQALGFSGIAYNASALFNRALGSGFQIDLAFIRKDKVVTLCELKYTQSPITKSEALDSLTRFTKAERLFPRHSIQRVLVSASGADPSVRDQMIFDRIIGLDEILDAERYFGASGFQVGER